MNFIKDNMGVANVLVFVDKILCEEKNNTEDKISLSVI